MSQHHLEEYFKQNREAFDQAVPSLKVWADIDNQLDEKFKPRRPIKMYLRIAAAVLVLVIAGAGVLTTITQQKTDTVATLPPDAKEAVSFYQQKFQQKHAQLVGLPHDVLINVDADLEEIDTFLEEVEKEVENAPKGAEAGIIEDLIKLHILRIQLLDRVLDRIQKEEPLDEKIVENESVSI